MRHPGNIGSVHLTTILLLLTAILQSGCLKLDPFLFKGKEIDEYQFDGYDGDRECADAVDSLGKADPATIRELSIPSGSETIAGVLVAPQAMFEAADTLVLYLHGTGPHIDYYWPRTRLVAAAGYPLLAIDFRGYGRSTGKPTEQGIYDDGFATMRFIREELGNPRVAVCAYSLGSIVACEIAAHDSGASIIALILEAPIGKLATLVQDAVYLDLPASYVISYEGNNVEKIREVSVPLLWLHGTDDETNTMETNGRQVYDNYQGVGHFCCIVQGAKHRTIPPTIGYNAYSKGLGDFIRGKAAENPLFAKEPE